MFGAKIPHQTASLKTLAAIIAENSGGISSDYSHLKFCK